MRSVSFQKMTSEIKGQILEGFSRHATAAVGYDGKADSVAIIATEEEQFLGAVVVEPFWGALHIKYVFVDERYRCKGIATMLMEKAFTYGRELNCPFAFVETMSFQALEFYRKLGFELEFTREGYEKGLSHHHLKKAIN